MKNLFKKIWNWIVTIPNDKLLHDYAGALICLFTFAVLFRFLPIWLCFVIADIVAAIALGLKELYDFKHPEGHSVEPMDFYYGLFGIMKVNLALLTMFI